MRLSINIYIPEPIPSRNKGEEAILQGFIKGLKNQGCNSKISLFSYNQEIDQQNYTDNVEVIDGQTFHPKPNRPLLFRVIETFTIWVKHFLFALTWQMFGEKTNYFFSKRYWRAYINADLVMVGHDGYISDLNLLFAIFVKLLGKRSAIFGGGFQGFRFSLTEYLAKYVLKMVDIIVVREKHCYDYLISLGSPVDKTFFRPDPAFIMEPADKKDVNLIFEKEGLNKKKRPLIGMIVLIDTRDYKYFYGISMDQNERFEKHMNFCAKIAEKIIDHTKGTIVFLPHVIKTEFGCDDRICAREIKQRMTRHSEYVVLVDKEYNASQLKGFIQNLDFLISQRLHAVIGAATVATPFIMVTAKEDKRSHDIIHHTISQPHLIFNLNAPTIEGFTEKFRLLWKNKEYLKKSLETNAIRIKAECNDAFRLMLERVRF